MTYKNRYWIYDNCDDLVNHVIEITSSLLKEEGDDRKVIVDYKKRSEYISDGSITIYINQYNFDLNPWKDEYQDFYGGYMIDIDILTDKIDKIVREMLEIDY